MYCLEMLVARLLQMAGGNVMDWLLTCNNHAYISILFQIFTTICLGNKTLLHQTLLTCVYRWPLLIDSTPQSSTFLRYRDTNFINALNPKHMEPDVIRLAILGGLRFVREVIDVYVVITCRRHCRYYSTMSVPFSPQVFI